MPAKTMDVIEDIKNIDEIITPAAQKLPSVIKRQPKTQASTDTISSRTHSYSFHIPSIPRALVSGGIVVFNIVSVNGQTCSNYTSIPTRGFYGMLTTGACLNDTYMGWDFDGPNRSWVPPFNLAFYFISTSSKKLYEFANLMGWWPYTDWQQGECGVNFKGACEYDPVLAGIPAYELANITGPDNTVIRFTGMGFNLSACPSELLSCMYNGAKRIAAQTPIPTTTPAPTDTVVPTNSSTPNPANSSINPYFLIGVILFGTTFLALLGTLIYRRYIRAQPILQEAELLTINGDEEAPLKAGVAANLVRQSAIFTEGQPSSLTPGQTQDQPDSQLHYKA